jgi:hypothetical protein
MLPNVPPAAVQSFRRKLSHSALRDYCARIASGKRLPGPRGLSGVAAADANARVAAQTFVDLQEERHSADYAHEETFDLVRLNASIALARRGLNILQDHRTEPGMASFLSLLAMTTTWAETGA